MISNGGCCTNDSISCRLLNYGNKLTWYKWSPRMFGCFKENSLLKNEENKNCEQKFNGGKLLSRHQFKFDPIINNWIP